MVSTGNLVVAFFRYKILLKGVATAPRTREEDDEDEDPSSSPENSANERPGEAPEDVFWASSRLSFPSVM